MLRSLQGTGRQHVLKMGMLYAPRHHAVSNSAEIVDTVTQRVVERVALYSMLVTTLHGSAWSFPSRSSGKSTLH
jgi:hypothetical protein